MSKLKWSPVWFCSSIIVCPVKLMSLMVALSTAFVKVMVVVVFVGFGEMVNNAASQF